LVSANTTKIAMPLTSFFQRSLPTVDLRTRTLTNVSIGRMYQVFQRPQQLIGLPCILPHQSGILSIEFDEVGQVAQRVGYPSNIGHKLIDIRE
jgi:hypothetical protein